MKGEKLPIDRNFDFTIPPKFNNRPSLRIDKGRANQIRSENDFFQRNASLKIFSTSSRLNPFCPTATWLDSKRKLNPPFET